MNKKFTKVANNVYAVTADTSQELAKLFLRFQEYYESPEFKDRVFGLEEFRDWYMASRNLSEFTYYDDWSGFNVPGSVVNYVANNFPDLTDDEKWLIEQVRKANVSGKYYVIGYQKSASGTLKHEIAHALFYLNIDYRAAVGRILHKNEGVLKDLGDYLLKLGYNSSVVEDEKHAYLLAERRYLKENKLWIPQFDMLNRQINKLFKEYS